MSVGGPGLADIRKSKAGINVQKAYGFLVRTWVRLPPGPLEVLLTRVFRNLIKSNNRRNLNELRRLSVYKPLYLRVHTDTAETLKILPTGYNMATEKIDFVKLQPVIPYRVRIDTAYFIVIQIIMSNFAAVKIMRNSPLIGSKTRFTSALKTCMYEEYFQNKFLFTKQLFEQRWESIDYDAYSS